jgi:hypothetical protein
MDCVFEISEQSETENEENSAENNSAETAETEVESNKDDNLALSFE